jgi:L-asparaginase
MTVAVIFTGGTIASRVDAQAGGAVPALRGADILARTPELTGANIEVIDWGLLTASHMTFAQIIDIARLLERTLAREEVTGAVVAQGTDSIEETSFAYDLLVRSDKPIVVTGAMNNSSHPDYDGPANLRDAVACASSADLRRQGTLVVLDGRIIGADIAAKTHATALDSFQPRDGVAVGNVSNGEVHVTEPRRRVTLPAIPDRAAEPVFMVTGVVGMDGTQIRLLAPANPAGLVVAAAGTGNTHPDVQLAALELRAKGTSVVLCTRSPNGAPVPVYAFPGGGATWLRAGVPLSPLSPIKARIALGLALGVTATDDQLRAALRA